MKCTNPSMRTLIQFHLTIDVIITTGHINLKNKQLLSIKYDATNRKYIIINMVIEANRYIRLH